MTGKNKLKEVNIKDLNPKNIKEAIKLYKIIWCKYTFIK